VFIVPQFNAAVCSVDASSAHHQTIRCQLVRRLWSPNIVGISEYVWQRSASAWPLTDKAPNDGQDTRTRCVLAALTVGLKCHSAGCCFKSRGLSVLLVDAILASVEWHSTLGPALMCSCKCVCNVLGSLPHSHTLSLSLGAYIFIKDPLNWAVGNLADQNSIALAYRPLCQGYNTHTHTNGLLHGWLAG